MGALQKCPGKAAMAMFSLQPHIQLLVESCPGTQVLPIVVCTRSSRRCAVPSLPRRAACQMAAIESIAAFPSTATLCCAIPTAHKQRTGAQRAAAVGRSALALQTAVHHCNLLTR